MWESDNLGSMTIWGVGQFGEYDNLGSQWAVKSVIIGRCHNWKVSELEIVIWKVSELEIVRIRKCQNGKVSEWESVRIGKCQIGVSEFVFLF